MHTRRSLAAAVLLALTAAACTAEADPPFDSAAQSAIDVDSGEATVAVIDDPPDPDCNDADARPSRRPPEGLLDRPDSDLGPALAEIKERGTLRVGMGVDTLLFGYLNPGTDAIEGFDVDMARLVADSLLGDPDAIELIPVSSPQRLPALVDGSVDIVVKTMTINCKRWGTIDFSASYYEASQKVLVRRGSGLTGFADLAGQRVCAVEGTTSIDRAADLGAEPVSVQAWTDCLVLFQRDEVAAISTDDVILAGLAEQDPFAEILPEKLSEEPYGIGISKDSPELTEYVNAVLDEARADGSWLEIYNTWLQPTLGPTTEVPKSSYRS